MNRVQSLGLALPALLVSTAAFAGEPPYPAPMPMPEPQAEAVDHSHEIDHLQDQIDDLERQLEEERMRGEEAGEEVIVVNPPDIQVAEVEQRFRHNIVAGAGALGFIGNDLDFVDITGPAWNVRYGNNLPLAVGPYGPGFLTWEVGYTGATDTDDGDVVMTATLLETDLKWNTIPNSIVYPIISAGLGYGAWTREINDVEYEDLGTLTLPVAAGVEVALDNILFDARATYRPVFFDENEVQFTEIGMDNWEITGRIGARF